MADTTLVDTKEGPKASAHPNVRVVRDYLEAAGRQDFGTAASCFAPDLRYHVPGRNRLAGNFEGQTAAMDYYGEMMELSGGTYGVRGFADWLVSDDHVMPIAYEHVEVGGEALDWTRLILFRVEGSTMSEVWLFEEDQYAFDAVVGDGNEAWGGTTGSETYAGPPRMSGAVDDPKVRAVMGYQAAMARGDLGSARSVFRSDVEYRVPGESPFAGLYREPEAVMGYLGRLMEETGGTYAISRMHWLASEERVGLVTRNHATRGGRSLAWDEVILFLFEGGKKERIDLFSGDQYAVDGLFG